MRLGLFELVGLATTLIFAIPVANFGVWRILDGEVLFGAGLVGVAVAMVVLPHFFLDPGKILRRLVFGLLPDRFRPADGGSDDGTGTGPSG